jgi:hypothetical protein
MEKLRMGGNYTESATKEPRLTPMSQGNDSLVVYDVVSVGSPILL